MATGGEKKVGYSLATVGTLTLEKTKDKSPRYISIVVCQDKIVVLDSNTYKVKIHRLHDGKCLAMSDTLESVPRDMCLMDAMTICVLHDGLIKIMSIDSTDMSPVFTTTRSLRLQGVLDVYLGVVRFNNNLVVTGVKQGIMCWCIVSLEDGHVDTIHQICKGYECRVTTKDTIIYILCYAGYESPDNTGVYGFDILNPSQCKYTYKHQRLQWPTSIVINEDWNIFVCNYGYYPDYCIHQLTASCQLVAIFTQGIPWQLYALFWDNGRLYGSCSFNHDITVFQPVYQEGLIRRLMRSLGLGRSQKKLPIKHSQGEQTVPEVLVSDERKQPVTEKTSTVKEQGVVDQRHSSVESEVPPAIQVPLDSDVDNQGSAIPVEILRMDDKSLKLYKEALQDGKEKVYNIRVMVVGQYGVGKTTLTKRLLGQQVDISERTSTEGIDVYKHCCKIALDTGEWIIQHEDSEQLFRIQRLMKLLTHHTEKPEVNNEQRGQTEVIYQREKIEDLYCPVHDGDSDDDDTSAIISQSDLEQEADNTINRPGESSSFKVDQIPPAKDSSGVNIQEGGRCVTSKVDATMELLQLVVEKADKLEKSLVEYAALAMWDFAGQYVFYTTHQTFLTCRAIYLLVTDLTQHITDFVKDDECYFDTEGLKLCKVQDLVQVWLNSVHCCAQSSATGTDSKPDNAVTSLAADTLLTSHGASTPVTLSDVGIPVTPPVILVGTHMDKIKQDKRQEVVNKYFQQICRILKDKPSLQHLVGFLAIDNTQLDPQLETLKKQIFQLASRQPYWGEELPANWLPLEEALMKLKASGSKVIPHSLVEKLNEAEAVPIKTTEQLDLFLRFQHETGNILYFSVQSLREWIVLDPKWLIDALKSLITAETFVLNNNPAARSMWFEFKENGKLTSQLIDAIWTKEKHPEFHGSKEIILQLMEKLNIVARPRLYSPDAEEVKVEGYFLAPCMLRQATPKDLLSLGLNSQQRNTSVLCFVFMGKFLPMPVFHRLLAACVAQWPIARQNMENLIFCGCCLFDLDLHHRLTLLFREHGIFARVTIIGTIENAPSYKLCIEVREFLTRTLCSIIGCLGQSLQFDLSIQCPQSDRYSVDYQIPVATLQGNVDVPCHFHDKSHVIISHDLLKFWFQEEEQSADGSRVKKTNRKAELQISDTLSSSQRKRIRMSALKGPLTDPELLCQVLKKSTQADCSSRRTLEENCQIMGLKFHGETLGNGNCFFEAVSSQLQRLNCAVQKSPQQLRHDVVAFMKANTILQVSEGTINLAEFISNGNFNDYCERMAQDGEWADHVVVVGMARMLQTDIMIVTSAPSSGPDNIIAWVVGQTNFNGEPILLGHIWENHYQSLQPMGTYMTHGVQDQAGNMKADINQTEAVFVHQQLVLQAKSVGIIRSHSTSGTGFRVGPNYIMTAKHVVDDIIKGVEYLEAFIAPVPLQHQMQLNPHNLLNTKKVYIDFSYERDGVPKDESLKFYFEPVIVYANDNLDTAILKLKPDRKEEYPPPLTKFNDVTHLSQGRNGYLIGHSRADIKKTDKYQLYMPSQHEIKAAMDWSMQHVNVNGYSGIDNPHCVLLNCSFEKGASGAPGFYISPVDGQAYLELMLLRGYPSWYYDDKYKAKTVGIQNSCLIEQGVHMKSIYDHMKTRDALLCQEIFQC